MLFNPIMLVEADISSCNTIPENTSAIIIAQKPCPIRLSHNIHVERPRLKDINKIDIHIATELSFTIHEYGNRPII